MGWLHSTQTTCWVVTGITGTQTPTLRAAVYDVMQALKVKYLLSSQLMLQDSSEGDSPPKRPRTSYGDASRSGPSSSQPQGYSQGVSKAILSMWAAVSCWIYPFIPYSEMPTCQRWMTDIWYPCCTHGKLMWISVDLQPTSQTLTISDISNQPPHIGMPVSSGSCEYYVVVAIRCMLYNYVATILDKTCWHMR